VRGLRLRSFSTPVVVVLASWLCAVPLVVASTLRSGHEGVSAKPPAGLTVAGAAQLPACTIIGTAASETLVGTSGDDVICALGGDDVVRGRGGDDTLFGSMGNDRLEGGPGDDLLKGHWGTDRLSGGRGNDVLHGGGNADVLSGGAGMDLADYGTRFRPVHVSIGRRANDGVTGEDDEVRGDVEDVRGGSADDTFVGDGGPNRLYGRGGDDELKGGRGNDRLWGGAGVDRLDGRDNGRFEDALDCGPGRPDAAMADARDRVASDCENVRQPQPGAGNRAPTDVTLSNASVAENRPVGTVVGTLGAADQDAGDVHRFALVAGGGGGDNAAFAIEGDQLRTAAVFDYETKAGYSIRIRVTDGNGGAFVKRLTIAVSDVVEIVNHAPSNILLSAASVVENEPAGTTVGTLSAVDADAGQAHGFALVAGAGDADNAAFTVSGAQLQTAAVFDFEAKASYSIRVRVTDNGTPALSAERVLTVTVTDDAAEPPAAGPTPPATTAEDTPVTITLSASDPEGDDPLTFATGAPANGSVGAIAPVTCSHATPNVCTADVLFTPAADYNGPAGFSYTANDGTADSLSATVSITVDPVNDAPVAQSGARTTNEDTPLALDLAALVSDVETADANLTYEIVTAPAHGTATVTTYTPAGDFNGSDSLTYRVSDRGDPDNCAAAPCDGPETSATETVSITVSPVNDTPTAIASSVSVAEDGALPIDLAALVADVETADANLTYTILTPPAHGAFAAGTYTPAGDFNGPDSFSYRVTDRGDPDNCGAPGPACDAPETSSTQTVSITVTAVNDAPVNFLPAGPVTVVQDTDTPLAGLSVADVDAGTDHVELRLAILHGTLTLDLTVAGGVSGMHVTGNETATVVITATVAQINTTLADLAGLGYLPAVGYTGPDTLTVTSSDLGHNGAGGTQIDVDTLAITVIPPNAAPVAAAQNVNTNEDAPLVITLSASDADGDDPLSFAIATAPAQGGLGAIGAVTCNQLTPNVCTAPVTYTPGADYNGPDSFTFTAADGAATSAPAMVSITVNAVNDAPTLANIEGGALAYTENGPATPVTATTTVADVDSANFDTGTLTVDYAIGGTADDRLEIADQGTGPGQIGVSGANVSYQGTQIGTFTGGSGTTPLVVTLDADTTAAATQALVRAVTFRNVSDNPSTAARTARFVLTDGDGGTSTPATRAIAVTAVNDPPVVNLDAPGGLTYTEQAGFVNLFGPAATVADADSPTLDSLTVTITAGFDAAFDTLDLNTAGFTANFAGGALTITRAGGTPAEFTTALRNVRFRNTDDDPDDRDDGTPDPSAADRTVSVVADDGPATSTPVTRAITITPVNDAPGAPTPAPTADSVRNTTLVSGTNSVTGPKVTRTINLEGNATDPDGPESAITVVPAAAAATAQGGRITLNAAGDLIYEPPASVTLASDTYGYQLTDGTSASAAITFTVNLSGEVWYVADSAPLPRDGTAARPFDTLAAVLAVATTNDAIHIRRAPGDGALTAGVTLLAGQKLLGEGVALTGTDVGASGSPGTLFAAGTKPILTATGTDVVTLGNTTEIAGLSINPDGAGGGLAGTNPTALTVRDADITDTGTPASQPGIELTTGGGLTFSGTVTVAMPAARALALTGTALSGTLASTSAGGTTGGVSLTNTTGNLTFQTLNLTTTGGTGFLLSGAANIDVDGAAFATTVSSTNGPAVDATGLTNGSDLVFDTITASGGAKGVNLDGTGNWTFSAGAGSTIAGATTAAFDVNGGSGAVTYAGSIANGTGEAVDITARSGNTTISGNITGTGGTGINVANNTAGTTILSGSAKTLTTGASQAVSLSSNAGHTIAFTGGGLDVDTTTGVGFGATGGGTVTVQGPSNSVTTTTGTAVNVAATNIGAAGMTFGSISANGASNGIALNNTGAAGSFVVTGDGDGNPDGGGGTITNSTSHALNLANTLSPSLADMTVSNAGNADNEYGLHLTNVSGTVTLDDMTFNNAADNLVSLNSTTSSTINVTGSVFSYPGAVSATANSAMLLEPGGTASLTASITGSTFTNILSASTQIGANTAAASGTVSLTFANNTINSAAGRAGGVVVSGQELTTTSLSITNNTFTGAGGNGVISIDTNDSSTVTGTISGNVISNPPGIGIFSAVDESGTSTLTFNNNTVTNAGGDGIQLVNFGGVGSSTMNATVTNNTVNGHSLNTAVSFVGGISVTGFEEVMDLQLTGNTVTGTPASSTQCGGAPCVDYYLEEVGGAFRLEEIPDTPATTASAAYVNATNDAGPVTIFGVIDLSNGVEISGS
jgi:Bacterial Ig domain/Cadherin domain/RTX calcium-binding nonapeptide repeat (4 copies)/Right handed beta helix region